MAVLDAAVGLSAGRASMIVVQVPPERGRASRAHRYSPGVGGTIRARKNQTEHSETRPLRGEKNAVGQSAFDGQNALNQNAREKKRAENETEDDRQSGDQTDGQTPGQTQSQSEDDRQSGEQTDGQTRHQTNRQTRDQTDGQTHGQTRRGAHDQTRRRALAQTRHGAGRQTQIALRGHGTPPDALRRRPVRSPRLPCHAPAPGAGQVQLKNRRGAPACSARAAAVAV